MSRALARSERRPNDAYYTPDELAAGPMTHDDRLNIVRYYAWRYMGSLLRALDADDREQVFAIAALTDTDDKAKLRAAVRREVLEAARQAGIAKHCRVPQCDRAEVVLRRGRCSRCARRAQRGGWSDQDPAGDAKRYAVYVALRPASRLAHARVGRNPGGAARLMARGRHRDGGRFTAAGGEP